MRPEERAALEEVVRDSPSVSLWTPLPGPQTVAYESLADELFYGGAAGGGKSSLIAGLAMTRHRRSMIVRRESTQLRGLTDDIARLLGTRDGYNSQTGQWRIPPHLALFPNQLIEFQGVPNPGDEERHQGIPHDLLAFDEVTQLREYVIDYLSTWNRTSEPDQRCRIVLTSNPPTPSTQYGSRGQSSGGGAWIVRRYAPWLDPQYRDPFGRGKAAPGELRWYATVDGVEREYEGPEPFEHVDAKTGRAEVVTPKSRTFIPALATDNPYTGETYVATLQKLAEPLRSAMLYGDFSVSLSDQPLQLIPSEWLRAATSRHMGLAEHLAPPADPSRSMTAIGADIARGGADTTILVKRWGNYFEKPVALPKGVTSDGPSAAGEILKHRRDGAVLMIDANGVGASVYDHLRVNAPDDEAIKAHVGSVASDARDRSGKLGFVNKRSEVYWKLREALDPASNVRLFIPNDPDLVQELLTLTWEEQAGKIKVMTKKDHTKVLGRSPDRADALSIAWSVKDYNSDEYATAMTARESRLEDARSSRRESWHRAVPKGTRARWGDRDLPYPKRW